MTIGNGIFLFMLCLEALICIYGLVRNEWVYKVVRRAINKCETEEELGLLGSIVSLYWKMHNTYWWIWDEDKLLEKVGLK